MRYVPRELYAPDEIQATAGIVLATGSTAECSNVQARLLIGEVASGTIGGAGTLARAASCLDKDGCFVDARFELDDPDVESDHKQEVRSSGEINNS